MSIAFYINGFSNLKHNCGNNISNCIGCSLVTSFNSFSAIFENEFSHSSLSDNFMKRDSFSNSFFFKHNNLIFWTGSSFYTNKDIQTFNESSIIPNILMFSGEFFSNNEPHIENLFSFLKNGILAIDEARSIDNSELIINLFEQISGGFSLLLITHSRLYIVKDRIGRCSLLTKLSIIDNKPTLIISSVGAFEGREKVYNYPEMKKWMEVPPCIISLSFEDCFLRVYQYQKLTNIFTHQPLVSNDPATILMKTLSESIRKRLQRINSNRIAILFSGGIDCMVIAIAVDLLNVAYQSRRTTIPDRVSAINGIKELSSIAPNRSWNLVQVDVTRDQLQSFEDLIVRLIHPANTVMDFNIGSLLFFAGMGKGILEGKEYETSAQVFISGLGADELFGGYSRHRTIFNMKGAEGVKDELETEIERLFKRNLGRDDRLLGFWTRQARYPYLDEEIVLLASQIPLDKICNLSLPSGVGDKMILRELGNRLGLRSASFLPKRAMQFGSRIANRKIPGTVKLDEVVVKQLYDLNEMPPIVNINEHKGRRYKAALKRHPD